MPLPPVPPLGGGAGGAADDPPLELPPQAASTKAALAVIKSERNEGEEIGVEFILAPFVLA